MSRRHNEQRVEDRFPTSHARRKADEAIDAMPVHAPMHAFLDEWLRVYLASGGIDRAKGPS